MNQENKETQIPTSKYFLSNTEFIWTINKIDSIDEKNRPVGPPLRNLALGDRVEYIDPELSYDKDGKFLRTYIVPIIEITFSEVLISRPNINFGVGFGKRYLLGNFSRVIDYHPLNFEKSFIERANDYVRNNIAILGLLILFIISVLIVIVLK